MRYIFLLFTLILASAFGTSASAITISEPIDATDGDFDQGVDIFDLSLGTNTISGSVNCVRNQLFTSELICLSALGTDPLDDDPFDEFVVLRNGLEITSITFEVTSFETTNPNDPGFFYEIEVFSSLMPLDMFDLTFGALPGVGSTGNVLPPVQLPAQIDSFFLNASTQRGAGLLTETQTSIDWTVTIETAAVPLPAGFPLLAAGLGALMLL